MTPSLAVAAPASTTVSYRIDADDRLVAIGGAWEPFAAENGSPGEVTGRSLWDFVAGGDVRATWALLLRHVRRTHEPVAFRYRCDAPGLRRLMRMELATGEDGSVAFRSTPVRLEEALTLSGRWTPFSTLKTVVVCGWCARVRLDGWVAMDAAVDAFGLAGREARMPRLTHGICESCATELRALARS